MSVESSGTAVISCLDLLVAEPSTALSPVPLICFCRVPRTVLHWPLLCHSMVAQGINPDAVPMFGAYLIQPLAISFVTL